MFAGYYPAIKRSETRIYVTLRKNCKTTMLSKRSQTQNVICCMIPLYEISRTGKCTEIEHRLVVARSWGRLWAGKRVTADGYGGRFWGNENILELVKVVITQHCEGAKMSLNCSLKSNAFY